MPTVLNRADILQLVDNRLDQRSLAQHQLVEERQEPILHVVLQPGNQFVTLCKELLCLRVGP